MRTVFVTTPTNDCANHVRAWRSIAPAERIVMHARGIRDDSKVVSAVRSAEPDLIFYIGPNQGPYALRQRALRDLRGLAPSIHLCSDAGDGPWHGVLRAYRQTDCFDLQVSLDGSKPYGIDLASLTPVAPEPFAGPGPERDIRCGFSGTCGRSTPRSEALRALEWFAGLVIREREKRGGYGAHVAFLRRCRMLINTSWTGTGMAHHVKGRIVEAGWAGCALLELVGSPIGDWLPDDCYFTWSCPKEAAEIIRDASDEEVARRAARLSLEVRTRFSPRVLYGAMLEKLGVGHSLALPAP